MIPTREEMIKFEGGNFHKKWASTGLYWQCPSCVRNKYEVIRKVKIYKGYDLRWSIHKHHDHGTDYGLQKRFCPTNLCGMCNTTEGALKNKLNLPPFFSFAPWEISKCIISRPHFTHEINFGKADNLFKEISKDLEFKYCTGKKEWIITRELPALLSDGELSFIQTKDKTKKNNQTTRKESLLECIESAQEIVRYCNGKRIWRRTSKFIWTKRGNTKTVILL